MFKIFQNETLHFLLKNFTWLIGYFAMINLFHILFLTFFFKIYPINFSKFIAFAVPIINIISIIYIAKNVNSGISLKKIIASTVVISIGFSFTFLLYFIGDDFCFVFFKDCLSIEKALISRTSLTLNIFLKFGPACIGFILGMIICFMPYNVLSSIFSKFYSNKKQDDNLQKEMLVTREESLTHEYKSFFQTPIGGMPSPEIINGQTIFKFGNKDYKHINNIKTLLQTQCLKTIVAFLNTEGGNLIIGVQETKNRNNIILGIENEVDFKDIDSYERHFIQQIINRIGEKFASGFIKTTYLEVERKKIFCVNVLKYIPKKGEIPAMLDKKDTYRRTGPRTDKINDGEEFARFVTERQA